MVISLQNMIKSSRVQKKTKLGHAMDFLSVGGNLNVVIKIMCLKTHLQIKPFIESTCNLLFRETTCKLEFLLKPYVQHQVYNSFTL